MQPSPPTIAIIGRTNVGKSTLFNRLLEKPKALVSKKAGTTRDRNEGECLWRGSVIRVIDTGGLDANLEDVIERNIVKQAELAMKEADIILFIVDLKAGVLPQDNQLAASLQGSKVPIMLVGNKAETVYERASALEPQWRLQGMPAPFPISALRGTGVGDLLDEIYDRLEEAGKSPTPPTESEATKVAVIGKPNVGKSTLVNAVLGEERFITSPIAHTTREPNDTLVEFDGKSYIFVDTAGMRKRGKVKKAGGLEAAAVKRNEKVIRAADVCLLVIDATERIGTQEKTLAGLLKQSGAGVIVIVNKWDLVEDKKTNTMKEYREYIAASIPFLQWSPTLFVSALTTKRVPKIFELIDTVQTNRTVEIDEKKLEVFLKKAQAHRGAIRGKGPKPPKILGMKQVKTAPPQFDLVIKAKRKDVLSISYTRYLQNRLREEFNLLGTPIKINVRLATSVAK